MDQGAAESLRACSDSSSNNGGNIVIGVTLESLGRLGLSMLLGSVLMGLSVAVGWILARFRTSWPVRYVDWWLSHIVIPLLRARRWSNRTIIIFSNNTLVLGLLVALGRWHAPGRIGVIVAGLMLGIAVHRLSERLSPDSFLTEPTDRRTQRLITLGVALNLLEIVAIIVSLGLTIGATDLQIPSDQIWRVFRVLVVPTLLVAAAGEALWIGATVARPTSSGKPGSTDADETIDTTPSDHDTD